MKVEVVQISIEDDIEVNYKKIKNKLSDVRNNEADLFVFPELTLTGFYKKEVKKQDKVNRYLNEISTICNKKNIGVIIGHPEKADEKIYNSASIILPDQEIKNYKKIHLTKKEEDFFAQGNKNVTFSYQGMKFGVIICKDQDFGNQILELKKSGINMLFILAGHYYEPKEAKLKIEKNRAFPIVRALENNIYVFEANAVGNYYNKVSLGNSMIISPKGTVIKNGDEISESCLTYEVINNTNNIEYLM
jgi:predicted amidohydrolase